MRTISGTSSTAPATKTPPTAAAAPALPAHRGDPTLAAALFAAWSGDPAIVVQSPPGAGKTRLVTHLAHQLSTRAGLRVAIAGQTRVQVHDLAARVGALGARCHLLDGKNTYRPHGLPDTVTHLPGVSALRRVDGIVTATTARWLHTDVTAYRADILLIDEAYQLTYADLGALGALAAQVVLVGDPGQISPVVTGQTHRWAADPAGPHVPAPAALIAAHGDAVTALRLPHTWRCGPATTALIQPAFYPTLPFTSARPPIHLRRGPTTLPELATAPLTPTGPHDPLISRAAADQVRALLHGTIVVEPGTPARPLTAADLAVVTPHVHQSALVSALLADLGPDLLIGTANTVQGAERTATVVIHPLTGHREATPFNTDPGRTCVALTRHRAHTTVITDTATAQVLATAARETPDNTWYPVHAVLLEALHAKP